MPPPPSSPQLYAGCPSCRNPPWLGTGTKYAGLHTWRLGGLSKPHYKWKSSKLSDTVPVRLLSLQWFQRTASIAARIHFRYSIRNISHQCMKQELCHVEYRLRLIRREWFVLETATKWQILNKTYTIQDYAAVKQIFHQKIKIKSPHFRCNTNPMVTFWAT